MGTETIEVRADVYDRLQARKRDDESDTDLLERLLNESFPGRSAGVGIQSPEEVNELQNWPRP
ncbi:MAG: antitoxin VapB family protein [Haloferacaceae archaeon]